MGRDAGASEHRTPEELVGAVLGTCTMERILGRGGMGVVYLAQQSRPHRQVAVKTLLLSMMPDPERRSRFLQRFRREADAVAALEHPNILPIYEYGEQSDLAYLVMPYVAGGTLRDLVQKRGSLPLPEVAGFLTQAAAALDYAHTHGVIHRDVKPQNMLLYPDQRLMLSDFGIAKVAEQAASDDDNAATLPQLTTMGHVVGTPDYIAPEQAMGQTVDARADIYSLGVVLFYMITGRVPFAGAQPMTVAAKHVSEPPPPPRQFRPDLPVAAEQVILKALAKSPAERYSTAGEFARAFRSALSKATQPAVVPAPNVGQGKAGAPVVVAPSQTPKASDPRRSTRSPQAPPVASGPGAGGKQSGRPWLIIGIIIVVAAILIVGSAYAIINNQPQANTTPTVTTGTTPTATATPGVTPSPTGTTTVTVTPSPTTFTADQFLPQAGDLPTGTTLGTSQTVTTTDDFKNLNLSLAVDPTQAQYNWKAESYVEVNQDSNIYLKIAIAQFTATADAQNYYAAILPNIQSQQQLAIGQSAVAGLCCGDNAADFNVVFQDQNVVAIVLLAITPTDTGKNDAQSVATKMDTRGHPPAAALNPDSLLATLQQRRNAAA